MSNVKIQGIEIFHPSKKVNNDYYIEHFAKLGKNIGRLLEAYGRKERYIIDNDEETIITMSTKAGKKVLESCNLTGDDIDLLIVVTETPEYIWPTNALVVFKELAINSKAQFYDMNANCLGMMNAVTTANLMLKGSTKMKRALVIGSDQFSIVNNKENEYLYPLFGDSACAVILEKTDDSDSGIIDSSFLSEGTKALDYVLFPRKGFSDVFNNNSKLDSNWEDFDAGFFPDVAYELNNELLKRNSLSFNDVNAFCYSQYAMALTKKISNRFNVDLDKFVYVGDKYGYTGTNSPFIALNEAVKNGTIKRGDIVNLWSIGTFWTSCGILMKY